MRGLTVHLLGRPTLTQPSGAGRALRGRKSWALLTYLLLTRHPPSRAHVSSLLFADANDPLRALRWTLAEIRRGLDGAATIGGDPLRVQLAPGTTVDVAVVTEAPWQEAVDLPGLGAELLEGMSIQRAPAFEPWLLSEQRRVQAASEAVLHEAALGSLSRGRLHQGLEYAARAASMNPLEESHHALLIRLYRLAGDHAAADEQLRRCTELFATELGSAPGPAVQAAMRVSPAREGHVDPDAVAAMVEAGSAATAAGSASAGIQSLREAVALSDSSGPEQLRIRARLVLAEALIHATGGLDEAGLEMLYEADEIAARGSDRASMSQARAELGYVDFLRGRYSRAVHWLESSLRCAGDSAALNGKATMYLGGVASDRGDYPSATILVERAIALSQEARQPRAEAFALSLAGRIALVRGDLGTAEACLDESIALAERDHWLAFLPWPQALRGEVELTRGETAWAQARLRQAFARACQLSDPCYEGAAGRGLGLLAEATGQTEDAFRLLAEARHRCTRLSDAYVWMEASILEALSRLGVRHDHPHAAQWVEELHRVASRAGMQEFVVRSLAYAGQLGQEGAHDAATLMSTQIDNPALHRMLELSRNAG